MSFFGGTVITVGVTSTKMMEEYPNLISDAVLTAILTPDDIPAYVLSAYMAGFKSQADQYLAYAKSDYYYGLPEGTANYSAVDRDVLDAAIAVVVGEPVTVEIAFISEPDYLYFVFEYLQSNHGWRYETNLIQIETGSDDSGNPEYLAWKYNSYNVGARMEDAWGNSYIDNSLIEIWDVQKLHRFLVPVPQNKLYYHFTYYLDSSTSTDIWYFWYDPSTHGVPSLDLPEDTNIVSDFYPIVPIRLQGTFLNENPGSTKCETTRTLLKKININLDEITDSIGESEDIDEVADAYVVFGLDIYTEEDASIDYLFKFFTALGPNSSVTKEVYESSRFAPNGPYPTPYNKFAVNETIFNTEIQYDWIVSGWYWGDVGNGKVGNVSKEVRVFPFSTACTDYEATGGLQCYDYENSDVIIRKQTEEGIISWVQIHGLSHVSKVMYEGSISDPAYKMTYKHLSDDDLERNGFFIPLNYDLLKSFNNVDEDYILYDALQVVIYAVHEEDLAWYQGQGFTGLVQIVMTLFAAFTMGASIAVNVATQTGMMMLIATLKLIVMAIAINFVIKLLIKSLGTAGAIVAVVGMIALAAAGGLGQGINGLPFAETLMKAIQLVGKVMKESLKQQAEALQDDYQDFLSDKEEMDDQFEMAQDMLSVDNTFNPLYITHSTQDAMDPNESVDQFYQRACHTMNPGVLSLDAIVGYVDGQLILPKANSINDNALIA